MEELKSVHITLQPDGVAAAANRIVVMASQVVGTCLRALEADDCEEPRAWGGDFGYQFQGLELSPLERREAFKNWVLGKGFQDLARGVRATLEEGLLFLKMLQMPSGVMTTWGAVEADIAEIRATAAKLNFPTLMSQVNAGLKEPMAFEAEFQSLQKVRNCLEHRGGRVGPKDVDPDTGKLALTFPRLKAFYLRGEEEVELVVGEAIDTHSPSNPFGKGEEVAIYIKRVTRSREYELHEPVIIGDRDFFEIALACQIFASDVATKLPSAANRK